MENMYFLPRSRYLVTGYPSSIQLWTFLYGQLLWCSNRLNIIKQSAFFRSIFLSSWVLAIIISYDSLIPFHKLWWFPLSHRTRSPKKRAVANPRLRPRGHCDRYKEKFHFIYLCKYINVDSISCFLWTYRSWFNSFSKVTRPGGGRPGNLGSISDGE
jgi:hypothetical protein